MINLFISLCLCLNITPLSAQDKILAYKHINRLENQIIDIKNKKYPIGTQQWIKDADSILIKLKSEKLASLKDVKTDDKTSSKNVSSSLLKILAGQNISKSSSSPVFGSSARDYSFISKDQAASDEINRIIETTTDNFELYKGLDEKEQKFLLKIGVSDLNLFLSKESLIKTKDLSNFYFKPLSQIIDYHTTATCFGFAVTSDMEYSGMLVYKNKRLAPLFAYYIGLMSSDYTIIREISKQPTDYDLLNAIIDTNPLLQYAAIYFHYKPQIKSIYTKYILSHAGNINNYSLGRGIDDWSKGLRLLRAFPVFSASANETNIASMNTYLKNGKQSFYVINNFESLVFDEKPAFNFFRGLIDSDKPFIAEIDSDNRTITEDWINIKPFGSFQHSINIVGYGKGVDPVDLQEKIFFIVRDSLTDAPIHYKISAKNLIDHIIGITKVIEIKDVTDDFID